MLLQDPRPLEDKRDELAQARHPNLLITCIPLHPSFRALDSSGVLACTTQNLMVGS